MIDWSTVTPALVELFTRLAFPSRPDRFKAQVDGRVQRYTDTDSKTDLVLKLRHVSDIGEDETEQREVTGKTVYAQLGNRRVIIEVRIETYKNTDDNWAWSTVERIRTRLRRPSSHEALRSINFALVETGPSIALPMNVKGAEWSAAMMELTFGTRFEDIETTPFNWIERVDLTSHIKDTDGQELPVPPNFNELIP